MYAYYIRYNREKRITKIIKFSNSMWHMLSIIDIKLCTDYFCIHCSCTILGDVPKKMQLSKNKIHSKMDVYIILYIYKIYKCNK